MTDKIEAPERPPEPSDAERWEWPDATMRYVDWLEQQEDVAQAIVARAEAAEMALETQIEAQQKDRAREARMWEALRAIENAENHIRGDWFELADWQRRRARAALKDGGET